MDLPLWFFIVAGVLWLIPGFVILLRRGQGLNGAGEALIIAAQWPLYIRKGTK